LSYKPLIDLNVPDRAPPGRAPHRRSESARLAVLHAADDLLVERGYRALTIEGIAARAGVAKQTIYRWWPSKVDILLDVLADDGKDVLAVPDTGSAIDDARRHLRDLARFLTKEPAGKVLLALMGEAQQDPDVARLLAERHLHAQRLAERGMIRRGIASGELNASLDVDATLDALVGPVYYRAMTNRPVSRAFVDGLVARTLVPAG
jgi:AcrR family transcriptional regulator